MTKQEKKECGKLLFEILYVSFLLLFLTWFWFGPRQALLKKQKQKGYQIEGLSKLTVTKQLQAKTITLQKEDGKGDLMLLFQTTDKSYLYNSILYQVLVDGKETEPRWMREDGSIYLLTLEELQRKERKTIELRIWTEEENPILGELTVLPVVREEKV